MRTSSARVGRDAPVAALRAVTVDDVDAGDADEEPGRRAVIGRRLALLAVPLAFGVSSVLVVQGSRAASLASLETAQNGWRTGIVTVGSDSSSNALFEVTNLAPGGSGSRCLTVQYTGDVAATVRMWASASGPLASQISLTVQEGSGGGAGSCAGFTPSATLFGPGTLGSLATSHGGVSTGLSSWAPSGAEVRTFRLSWSFNGTNVSQGKSANATFTWQATQA